MAGQRESQSAGLGVGKNRSEWSRVSWKESKQASRAGEGEVDQVIKRQRQQRQRRKRFAQRTVDDIVSISGAWARVLAPHSDLRAAARSKQVNCRLLAPAPIRACGA
jgi:hypothetical protein